MVPHTGTMYNNVPGYSVLVSKQPGLSFGELHIARRGGERATLACWPQGEAGSFATNRDR